MMLNEKNKVKRPFHMIVLEAWLEISLKGNLIESVAKAMQKDVERRHHLISISKKPTESGEWRLLKLLVS